MRFVRIDALGPAELHPRLTLLRGLSPEDRRRLVETLGEVFTGRRASSVGTIEINGVRLDLDGDTVDRLQLGDNLGWVLDLDPRHKNPRAIQVEAAEGARAGASSATGDTRSRLSDLETLRETLRRTASERSALAEEMEQVRTRLDSFAEAALEVCIGQIDALESRRSALRAEVEHQHATVLERLAELESTQQRHLAEIEAVKSLDLAPVRSRRDHLAQEIEQHQSPDPRSIELALRIDATMRRVRDLGGRNAAVSLRRREAEQRLAESVAEVTASERASQARSVDPAIVARLEQVRDELFADDERPSRLSVNRNRRRMATLRDEEARLLTQLGFDTYSSYVMGIPSLRSEVERTSRVDQARAKVDEIQRELDSMEEPSDALLATAEVELRELLQTAAVLLGNSADPTGAYGAAADEVAGVIEKLRATQLEASADESPKVIEAATSLRAEIVALAGGRFSEAEGLRPPRIAGSVIALAAWEGPPSQLLGAVDVWLNQLVDTTPWLERAAGAVEDLHVQIVELRESGSPSKEVGEWAHVEAELDKVLDRMAGAEERVRRNEAALVELASLREKELEIRSRERDLLARIAGLEEVMRTTPRPAAPLPQPDPQAQAEEPAEFSDPEWALISFAARRRSVSFAGSLPMFIFDLAACRETSAASREDVLVRAQRLSDLVQIVVVDDSDWAAQRVSTLGTEASIVTL